MPQYLAQDFVQQAVSKRQQLLGRMLLACPEHLEYVEAYPHQGRLTDSLFLAPWKHTTSEQAAVDGLCGLLPSLCEDERFWPELHSASALCVCLKELTEFCPSVLLSEMVFSDVADWPAAVSSPELIGSCRSHDQSHDTMSLEIELAMEAEEEGLATRMQGLRAESLQLWMGDKEDGELEDMLDPALFDLGVLHLPSLTALAWRLQPKPVQDPFTDQMGRQHTHATVLARDLQLGEVSSCCKGWLEHREVFLGEDLSCRTEEEEVVVAIAGSSRQALLPEPLTSSPVGAVESLCLPKLDPFADDDLEMEHELEGLCLAFPSKLGHGACGSGEPMEVGERGALQDKDSNFALMNHTSVPLSDSVDSGCQHMYLESPSCGTSERGEGGDRMTALSEEELALLESIPTSPEVAVRRMRIIESSEEKRLMDELRSKEMLFDDILACLLPVPKCPEQLTEIPSPLFSANVLCLKPVDKGTESEFSLLWDPLHDGHVAMEMAQMALKADTHFAAGGASYCPTLLREEEGVVFRREVLELQEAPEAYISLFGVEGCGRKAEYQPRTSLASVASLPSSISRITMTTVKPTSLMSSCRPAESQRHVTGRGSTAGGGIGIGGDTLTTNMSPLDFFVMMRKGSSQGSTQSGKSIHSSRASRPSLGGEGGREIGEGQGRLSEECCSEGRRQSEEIMLTGVLLMAYEVVEHQGQMALNTLQRVHPKQQLPARFGTVEVDTAAFLLRQQEAAAAAESNISPEQQGVVYESCRWSAILLVLVSVADCLLNSSFDSALNRLLQLTERYTNYIGDSLDHVRADLGKAQIQLTSGRGCLHPKAEWLVAKLASWNTTAEGAGRRKEKALVLIAGDFTAISAEVMNALSAVSGLSACVFALAPKHPGDTDYLQEVEARLQHYSCLVIPPSCIADCFPWERISLVIEYNTRTHDHTHTIKFHAHIEVYTLRGVVRGGVPVAAVDTWTQSASGGVQYKLICSQNVTSDVSLMQWLESRLNIVILERDYTSLAASSSDSKGEGLTRVLHYADVILDECCGILLHPLDQLSSPEGFKTVTTRVTTLSLQYEKLWILLYNSESGSYPYAGHVPVNISKIYASVANFSAEKDNFVVRVVVAGSMEDAACYVRKFGERAHSSTKSWSHEDWCKRNWLVDELSAHEKFLLHFPCLTAFSSQLMLATCSLKDLLTSDCSALLRRLPWIPEKCIKMFHTLSHLSTSPLTQTLPTHFTTTVAPVRAPHMPITSTTQGQRGLPVSNILFNNQQRGQRCGTHPIKAAIVPTRGVYSGLIDGRESAGSVPFDRLDVGGNGTTSNVVQNTVQNGSGDQLQHIMEQAQQPPDPGVKRHQKKSFYRYTATADSVVTQQGGSAKAGMQLAPPPGDASGCSPQQQQQVVRSKFFPDVHSHSGPEVGTQKGLKKLLAYGRQKEEERSTAPSTSNPVEQDRVLHKTTSKRMNHGGGSMDQVLPIAAVPPAPSIDGTWPLSSDMLKSRGEAGFAPPITDIWGQHQELLAEGKLSVEGGACREGGVAKSLPGTTPLGRKRQPVRCFSLDSEEEGMNSGPTRGGVVPSAKKRPLCPSMFTTPLGLEKRPIQGHLMTSGERFTPHREGGGAASAQSKPFDLQTFHSHQATGSGALVDSNAHNNHDLLADNEPRETLPAEAFPPCTPLPMRRESKWMQWMQGEGNEATTDSHFSFDFHPQQSPLQVVPPHHGHQHDQHH